MSLKRLRELQRANPELARVNATYVKALLAATTAQEQNDATHAYLIAGGYNVDRDCICPQHRGG